MFLGNKKKSSSHLSRCKQRMWNPQTTISSSVNQKVTAAKSPATASNVIRRFYDGLNSHDLVAVEEIIAENCVYEDLIFPHPCVGHKEVIEFFQQFFDSTSSDLHFVIDDISGEDSQAVGVIWHIEWKGKPMPCSKGCSFYRLETVNDKRQIIYGRDSVESAIKPGKAALEMEHATKQERHRF